MQAGRGSSRSARESHQPGRIPRAAAMHQLPRRKPQALAACCLRPLRSC
jgi:hypothetical protein